MVDAVVIIGHAVGMTYMKHLPRNVKRYDGLRYIYVAGVADGYGLGDRCKVGISDHAESRVLKGLQRASPVPLVLAHSALLQQAIAVAVEREMHMFLDPCHLHGEWFRCPPQDAAFLIDVAIKTPRDAYQKVWRPRLIEQCQHPPVMRIKREAIAMQNEFIGDVL